MVTIIGGIGTLTEIGSLFNTIDQVENKVLGASLDRSSVTTYINGVLDPEDFQRIHDRAISCGAKAISRITDLGMLAVSGEELETKPNIIEILTKALHAEGINIYGIFTSNSRIKLIVETSKMPVALQQCACLP